MARPRKGTELRQTITVSLDPVVLALLTVEAKNLRTSRSSLANDYIVAGLEGRPPRKPRAASGSTACNHPKDQRRVHSWGAVCGACDQRL